MLLANDRVRWPAFWTVAATLLLVQHLRFFFLSSDLPSASRYILAETTQGENNNLFIYLFICFNLGQNTITFQSLD